jgi:hypothetical protein
MRNLVGFTQTINHFEEQTITLALPTRQYILQNAAGINVIFLNWKGFNAYVAERGSFTFLP